MGVFTVGDALRAAAVDAGHELGLFEALSSPLTLAQLADRMKLRASHRLAALVDALVALGSLTRDGDSISRGVIAPRSAHPMIGGWGAIADVVRTDTPLAIDDAEIARRYQQHLVTASAPAARDVANMLVANREDGAEKTGDGPGFSASGTRTMHAIDIGEKTGDGPRLPASGTRTMRAIDIGGGAGAYTRAVLATDPRAHVTLVDMPEVIDLARIELADLGARVRFVAGDARELEFGADDARELELGAGEKTGDGPVFLVSGSRTSDARELELGAGALGAGDARELEFGAGDARELEAGAGEKTGDGPVFLVSGSRTSESRVVEGDAHGAGDARELELGAGEKTGDGPVFLVSGSRTSESRVVAGDAHGAGDARELELGAGEKTGDGPVFLVSGSRTSESRVVKGDAHGADDTRELELGAGEKTGDGPVFLVSGSRTSESRVVAGDAHVEGNARVVAGDAHVEGNARVVANDAARGAFDVAIVANVLHLHAPAACAELCASAGRVLRPGGLVAIVDLRRGTLEGEMFALNMAIYTEGGSVYSVDQIGAWLREAGLVGIDERRLESAPEMVVVLARRGDV